SQSVLANAVKLKRLPRRESQRAIRVLARQRIEREPLLGRTDAARQAHTHHELIAWLELGAPPLLAQVAVVLLIDAEEFGEQRVVVVDGAGRGVGQAALERAAQIAALVLEALVRVQLLERSGKIVLGRGVVHQ